MNDYDKPLRQSNDNDDEKNNNGNNSDNNNVDNNADDNDNHGDRDKLTTLPRYNSPGKCHEPLRHGTCLLY